MSPLRALAIAVAVLLPGSAAAQYKFQGLEPPKPKEKPADKNAVELDHLKGVPIVLVPPRKPGNKAVDVEGYKLLHAALKERVGARLVSAEATLKAIEDVKLVSTLTNPEIIARLAEEVKAELAISFEETPSKVEAHVYPNPGGAEKGEPMSWPWGMRKVGAPLAKIMVGDLLKTNGAVISPVQLAVVEPVVGPPEKDVPEDVSAEAVPIRKSLREPFDPVPIIALAGAGASFRGLTGTSQRPIIPVSPGAMAGFAFNLSIYPLRFIPSLAKGKLSDFWLEGSYRLNAAQAVVVPVETDPFNCAVSDDEIVLRASYRYPLPGRLPRVGLGVGWTSERTLFACAAPALSTRYQATELHLKLQEPIFGEKLGVELSGGPRFLFSERALGYTSSAFSFEGWVTGRPIDYLYLRAGLRLTSTTLTTWPDGVSLTDTRTFVGVELGAAI